MQDIFELFVKDNLAPLIKRVEVLETELSSVTTQANSVNNSLSNIANKAFAFNQISEAVSRITDTMGIAVNKAGAYSDQIADIQKATGQTKQETEALANEIAKFDTRTSLSNLLDIAKIGGSIGVAQDQIGGFVQTVDMATVALGDEFSGGVEQITRSLGTLKGVFSETKGMRADEAMSRIGSSINYLGSVGTATGGVMADFANRIGQLGSLAPTVTQTLGLGATLQELGLSAEIASGGLTNLILVAGENAERFAKQLGMGTQEFRNLLSNSPNDVITQLAESFKGLAGADIIQRLQALKIGTQESIKVFQALSENTDLLKLRQTQASEAFAENTSLSQEFAIKNETLGASLDKTRKFFESSAIAVGRYAAPIAPLITSLGSLAQMGVPVVGMLGRVGSSLGMLLNPYALATAGGIALASSFVDVENGTDSLNVGLRQMSEQLSDFTFENMLSGFGELYNAMGRLTGSIAGVRNELTNLGKVDFSDFAQVGNAVNKIQLDLITQGRGAGGTLGGNRAFTQGLFFLNADEQKKLIQLSQANLPDFFKGMSTSQISEYNALGIVDGTIRDSYDEQSIGKAQDKFLSNAYDRFIKQQGERIESLSGRLGYNVASDKDEISGLSIGKLLSSVNDDEVKRAIFLIDELEKNNKNKGLRDAFSPPSIQELKDTSLKNKGDEITGGGSKPVNITINIGKFQDSVNINSSTVETGINEIGDNLNEAFLRVIRGINQYR